MIKKLYKLFTSARSIVVSDNVVMVNGKIVGGKDDKIIKITIEGDCEEIHADSCTTIEVRGKVTGSVKTMSGDVRCGDVGGGVSTMSGDIVASKIQGSASSMSGDITGR